MSDAAKTGRPLVAGDARPEFEGTTATGGKLRRADLLGRPSVVFFYPKAGSPGCSVESRAFARHRPEFADVGARIVGVSVDPPEAQRRFRDSCDLPFDLIADSSKEISRRFGVLGVLGVARRTTFVVDRDGTIVHVIRSWRPAPHVTEALRELAARAPPATSGERSSGAP